MLSFNHSIINLTLSNKVTFFHRVIFTKLQNLTVLSSGHEYNSPLQISRCILALSIRFIFQELSNDSWKLFNNHFSIRPVKTFLRFNTGFNPFLGILKAVLYCSLYSIQSLIKHYKYKFIHYAIFKI